PVFLTVRSGLTTLVERLAAGLDVRLGHEVQELDGDIVLTVPAAAAARLLEQRAPAAADELRAMRTASVGMVLLAYDERAVSRPLDATGFVVPRVEGKLLTACSFATTKWPHWKVPGRVVLRASVGRSGDERWQGLDDDALVERVHEELVEMVGLREPPVDACVRRWVDAFPQYDVGHLARVERVERALPPGVVVAGAAYRGLGLPACIRQAQVAAARLLEEKSRS
ncbi:MAG: protoporphyrinogen oxidase, partial [Actinomycetota bacterium]|nr:protoporphyrinogen oxidase [Actinomycetota bacterium]